jgi:cytoskeletal protein CcmA (bactofilin family)
MFGKRRSTPTVIARGAVFEGTLRLTGPLHVDGLIDGHVHVEGSVTIGPQGCIRGEVDADVLSIAGRVEGRAAARAHLHMLAGGVLDGDATYTTLQVDNGGVIEGRAVRRGAEEEVVHERPLVPHATAVGTA